ncbi:MAG: energy transducer TonB [Alphaproteobacteria bacterium]|nr:energy transducer TonB [Alphaproteobacteria bacterium]
MFATLMALSAAVPASGPLPPRKAWIVDYAETFCTAVREYGDADAPLELVLRPSPNDSLLQLFVIRKSANATAEHVPVTVAFAGRTVKATALVYSVEKSGRKVVLTSLAPGDAAEIGRTGAIGLKGGRGIDWTFAVPGIDKAMAALAACNADLRAHWNMDAGRSAAIKTDAKPLAPLARWISSSDYPAQALRELDTGRSRVFLLIDEQGKVRDCLLEETSGNASLDAMTCIALRERGKFHPALDASGKPVRSVYGQAISWRIAP